MIIWARGAYSRWRGGRRGAHDPAVVARRLADEKALHRLVGLPPPVPVRARTGRTWPGRNLP